jgi:hypothetical protein
MQVTDGSLHKINVLSFFFLSCLYIETCQSGGLAFVPTDSEEKDENRTEFPADSRVLVQQR